VIKVYKAKDSPWDAVLMGSVASTVGTNVCKFFQNVINIYIFNI
jgi:hypothetical protein